jgi:site-specific DNA-methyltransferase (adenine-specific)
MKGLIVINGNNIEILKDYPDNYFDSVVTDPPYGLGKEPNAAELMKDWIQNGYHEVSGSGFMGKEWDAFVPQPVFWKEVFRVLKHGGHVLSFFGTRTYDWGVMSMRFAGFEVRDCIQWLYGSGFPKSHNISKALDKMQGAEREIIGKKQRGSVEEAKERGVGFLSDPANRNNTKQFGYGTELITTPSTESAKQWDGWGSALKPANEPIVLARKPLEKGLSIAENILKSGVGGINIDASRIGYREDDHVLKYEGYSNGQYKSEYEDGTSYKHGNQVQINTQGRFPANIILTHHPECECKGTKKVKSVSAYKSKDGYDNESIVFNGNLNSMKSDGYADENGNETVEDWDCHEDCPIRILDEQSGSVGGDSRKSKSTYDKGIWGNAKPIESKALYNDTGGASRFFYVAKASKSERNKGLEGFDTKQTIGGGGTYNEEAGAKYGSIKAEGKNFHPTVKPIKLMQYLVRMITPPNGIVLDPFCGSGTTGVACKLEGFQFVGMEQDPEYSKIAEGRINNYVEENGKSKKIKPKENEEPITTQTTLF